MAARQPRAVQDLSLGFQSRKLNANVEKAPISSRKASD
jgi:hypothetical protein